MLILLPVVGLVHEIYFDRSGLPDLQAFLRFELPTIGAIHDARGEVLIELAREYRRVVSYDELPMLITEPGVPIPAGARATREALNESAEARREAADRRDIECAEDEGMTVRRR